MDKSTAARIGIASAVAGLGLTAGGIAMASAESSAPDTTTSSSSAQPGGPRGDRGQLAETLAAELGLDQTKVQAALDAVRDQLRPEKPNTTDGTRPAPPTEEQRAERQAALAKALASELGVSEAKVTAAFEKVQEQREANRAEHRAEGREALVERLDAAVEAGTLTAADKASVLKAFDAEVLGGGHRGPGHGGPGHGGPRGGDAAPEASAS